MKKTKCNIAFSLYIHPSNDERVYYQEAETLRKYGYEVSVVSVLDAAGKIDSVGEKINYLSSETAKKNPDIIICDTPLSVLSALVVKHKLHKTPKICYDITEWYPSDKNLSNVSVLLRPFKFLLLLFLSLFAGIASDVFLFGEEDKARPFRFLFRKKNALLPYYASKKYMKKVPRQKKDEDVFTLLYSGSLAKNKGIDSVVNVAVECARLRPQKKFVLKIISNATIAHSVDCENLEIQHVGYLQYADFCIRLNEADVFLDLRKIDRETTRCLPIKIFYYMACGKPVVYSNLKAIRKGIPEIDKFALLVNPQEETKIAESVLELLEDSKRYDSCCSAANELFEEKYNWENVEYRLVKLMEDTLL